MTVIQRDIIVCTCSACLATANQSLDGQDVACIHVTVFLLLQVFTDFSIFVIDDLVFAVVEDLVEPVDEVQEADNFFIAYGNVTGSFVSYMHVMFLLYQTTDGASHGDNVIIGMRRKYDHTFWIGLCTLRTIGVVSIRLAARPSGDGMLQVIEYLDVHVIG